MTKKVAVIYHSGYGHTAYMAKHVAQGVEEAKKVSVNVFTTEEAIKNMDILANYDGFIWGTPTYMGNVSGPFKMFMDASGGVWLKQGWKNKWAAGFTVSGSPSGDKQTTLISLAVLAAQHGMFWVPFQVTNEIYTGVDPEQAVNRLGSSLGFMAQSIGQQAPETSFLAGDLKSAKVFGENFANVVALKG
jgi:multimeric flavodoxin WrbA